VGRGAEGWGTVFSDRCEEGGRRLPAVLQPPQQAQGP
jgi:hypothetical protein